MTCIKGRGTSITSLEQDKTMIVSFEDPILSFDIAQPLKASLRELMRTKADEGYLHFILNFQNVKILDSTGAGLIMMAHNAMSSLHARLHLCHVCPFIAKVLNTMQILKHLSIFDTEEEVLAEVRKSPA